VTAKVPLHDVTDPVPIAGRLVGRAQPVYVVAEAGVNHDGRLDRALALIDAAADAGADAVKFQVFDADLLVARGTAKALYQAAADGAGETQDAMLRRLQLDRHAFARVAAHAAERGICFLASPFDEASVDLLVELGVPAIKIASPDLVNPSLLRKAASTALPLIVSTGMADLDETRAAVATARMAGAEHLVILHCVSAYPARAGDSNLAAMRTLADELHVPVGFSDHTLGTAVAVAAAALGAAMIEKHLTLDRTAPGPDHAASLEPMELAELVRACRDAAAAVGDGVKRPVPAELENLPVVRRSVAAAADLVAGSVLTRSALVALRPGTGIPAALLDELVGRALARDVARFQLLAPEDLA
jgi:N,N'-diacetyllegionaminate synthase